MKINFEQRYFGIVAYVQIGDREVRSYGEEDESEALAVLVQQLQEIIRDGQQAQQILLEGRPEKSRRRSSRDRRHLSGLQETGGDQQELRPGHRRQAVATISQGLLPHVASDGEETTMKHETMFEDHQLIEFAKQLGNLRYDQLATFINSLGNKIGWDSLCDQSRGREKLAEALVRASMAMYEASDAILDAWDICEPQMT